MSANDNAGPQEPPRPRNRALRLVLATVIAVLVLSYIIARIIGGISTARQLSTADVILLFLFIALIVGIVYPEVLRDISAFSAGGIRVELREVQQKQDNLDTFLRDIFPLLLPRNVRHHLEHLERAEQGQPGNKYEGKDYLREELRHLRYMGLIESVDNKPIGTIPSGSFVLQDYVKLTPTGRDWIDRAKRVGA